MFRIVAANHKAIDSGVDGLPEEMETEPGEPSADFGRRTSDDEHAAFHEFKLQPSAHSRTSLVSALHTTLSSSSSLHDEFHDCVNDTEDENHRIGEGNSQLLDWFVAFDDDARVRSDASIHPPPATASTPRRIASEQIDSDDVSDSAVQAKATSLHITWSARSILSRGSGLVTSAAVLALRTACLPVTLPLHVTGSLLGRVIGGTDGCQSDVVQQRKEEEESEESSSGSTESTTANDQSTVSSYALSCEKVHFLDEREARGWTAPLEAAIKVALLPVTGPMYLASTAGSVAVNGCSAAFSVTASLLEKALLIGSDATPRDPITSDPSLVKESSCKEELRPEGSPKRPSGKLIAPATHTTEVSGGLRGLSETMKDVSLKVVADLSFLLDSISPSLRDTLIDPRQEDRMLARLRLDYHFENDSVLDRVADPVLPVTPASSFYSAASSITVSGHAVEPLPSRPVTVVSPRVASPLLSDGLLRVDDLGIYRTNTDKQAMVLSRMYYLDLNEDMGTEVGDEAMSRLIGRGLGLVSNLQEARLQLPVHHHGSPKSIVDWKPERGSSEFILRLSKLSAAERVAELQSKTLVWSGQFRYPDGRGTKPFPLFASRGIIPWKPLDFVSLMWDDSRVHVYNKLCTGRSSVRVFRDEIDAGGSRGTKVVHFTTRVPLTNFTVTMTSLMHVAPIQTRNEEDAFIIISRSVCSGRSGSHFESHDHVDKGGSKSEIIWGVNIVQPVPNQSHLTDLTSISQVGTTMVPNILARKIGLWGVEDFYKNVRNHNA